ncbi:hypothetical protein RMR10_011255 [Agrobacterium rosae]|uniref:hypothetical protein n=1 Tax=Agrobacterium rosae TaxID=1972867 RepID=UPI00387AD32C
MSFFDDGFGRWSYAIAPLTRHPPPRVASAHCNNGQTELVLQVFNLFLHRFDSGCGVSVMALQNVFSHIFDGFGYLRLHVLNLHFSEPQCRMVSGNTRPGVNVVLLMFSTLNESTRLFIGLQALRFSR